MNITYPIQERNDKLLQFFTSRGFNAILIGDQNQPKIIIDNDYAVSGYVQNNLYHFTTKPFGGNVIFTINLNFCDDTTKEKIDSVMSKCNQRILWKIALANDESMCYFRSDFNTPLFTKGRCRFFFDEESANSMLDRLVESHEIECYVTSSKLI